MKRLLSILLFCLAIAASHGASSFSNFVAQLASDPQGVRTGGTNAGYDPLVLRSEAGGSVNRTLRQYHKALYSGSPLNFAAFGDSVGSAKLTALQTTLWDNYGSNGFAFAYTPWSYSLAGSYSNVTVVVTNWFDNHIILSNAPTPASMTFVNGGGPNSCTWSDTLEVYYEVSPGAGTFLLRSSTNGSGYTTRLTVSCNGAYRAAVTNITLPLGWYQLQILNSAGVVRILDGGQYNSASTGVRLSRLCKSGIDLGTVTNVSTNALYPIFQGLNLTTMFMELKDSVALFTNGLPRITQLVTNCGNFDVLAIGTTPSASGDETFAVPQNAIMREWARTNQFSYYDGYTPIAPYASMTNRFGTDDGTHPAAGAQYFLASDLAKQMGLPVPQMLAHVILTIISTNDPHTWTAAQTFSGENVFSGANAYIDLQDQADPNNASARVQLNYSGGVWRWRNLSGGAYAVNLDLAGALTPDPIYGMTFKLGTNGAPWVMWGTNSTFQGATTIDGYLAGETHFGGSGAYITLQDQADPNNASARVQLNYSGGVWRWRNLSGGAYAVNLDLAGALTPDPAYAQTFKLGTNGAPWVMTGTNSTFQGTTTLSASTNFINFANTNTAPPQTTTVRKWISVKVGTETNEYRLPLYGP